MATANDRFEVSVQGIMSCQSRGCNGGNAQAADTALSKYGIGKERDFRYRCGGGSAEKHFEVPNVKCTSSNSWGASCKFKPNPQWIYGRIARAGSGKWRQNAGEAAIMKTLVECGSGYINFKVYENFMKYKSGIYQSASGRKRGGHAVTLLGYGAKRGIKYWHIANSWGTRWGNNGYVDFLRGTNLAEIETSYYCIKGSVKGGSPGPSPPAPPAPPAPRPSFRPVPQPSPRPVPSGGGQPSGLSAQSVAKIEKNFQGALDGLDAIKPPLEEAKKELGNLKKKQTAMRDTPPPPLPLAPAPQPQPSPPRGRSPGSGRPSPSRSGRPSPSRRPARSAPSRPGKPSPAGSAPSLRPAPAPRRYPRRRSQRRYPRRRRRR